MSVLFAAAEVAEQAARILPDRFWMGILLSVVFGLLGTVLLLFGYWLFDKLTPQLDFQKELKDRNMALAIVIAALLLGIAYITAHIVT